MLVCVRITAWTGASLCVHQASKRQLPVNLISRQAWAAHHWVKSSEVIC